MGFWSHVKYLLSWILQVLSFPLPSVIFTLWNFDDFVGVGLKMSTITGPFYISAIHLSAAPARGSRTIFEGVRAEPGGKPVNYKTLRYIFVTHFLPKALFRVRVLVPPLQNPISTSSANRTRLRNERGNRSDFVSLLFV